MWGRITWWKGEKRITKKGLINGLTSRTRDRYTEKCFDSSLFTSYFDARSLNWGRTWLVCAMSSLPLCQQWQEGGYTDRCSATSPPFAFSRGISAGMGRRGARYTLGLYPHCWQTSFQFLVSLKWLWPRMNRQHSHSKQWNENCFEVTENRFTVTFRHHIVSFPDSSLVWKNGMPHNTSVSWKWRVLCIAWENLQLLPLSRRNAEPSFGEA